MVEGNGTRIFLRIEKKIDVLYLNLTGSVTYSNRTYLHSNDYLLMLIGPQNDLKVFPLIGRS